MRAKIPTDNGKETLLFIEENVLCAVEQAELSTVSEVLERMMNGFAVLLLDDCPEQRSRSARRALLRAGWMSPIRAGYAARLPRRLCGNLPDRRFALTTPSENDRTQF